MGEHKGYLLDTNVFSWYLRLRQGYASPETEKLRDHLQGIAEDSRLFLCVIDISEVEFGLNVAPYRDVEKQKLVRESLTAFPVLEIDENVAHAHAMLRARLFDYCAPKKRKHRGLEKKRIEEWLDPTTSKELQCQENDLWITAVAYGMKLVLVTHDKKMAPIKHVAGTDVQFEDWLE